jgi:hypothetical protein
MLPAGECDGVAPVFELRGDPDPLPGLTGGIA